MSNKLTDVVNSVIDSNSNQDELMPAWVANAAYRNIDPDQIAPIDVKIAALQYLKQLARQVLRGKFEPLEGNADQHELWPDLQTRYPVLRQNSDAEPTYVKLELLNGNDALWNINRLRKEADTKIKHANALEQWAAERGLLAGLMAA